MTVRRLIALLAVALPLAFAASAHAYVYWGDPQAGTIGRANLDGTNLTDSFIHTGGSPLQLAINSSYIYWANEPGGAIGRAKLDGTQVEPAFITGIGKPTGVAVSSEYIFWSTVAGSIGRAKLDGTEPKPSLITGVGVPCGVAVDSGSVYWQSNVALKGVIGRAPFTGISPQLEFVKETGSAGACGVAANSANIFWANTGFLSANATEIGRANASDGKAVNPSLIGDANGPCGVAVFGTQLYWPNKGNSTIARANTDGTAVNESLINVGAGEICGIAVDSLSSPVTPPPSGEPGPGPGSGGATGSGSGTSPTPTPPAPTPGSIRVRKVVYDKKHGTARISLATNEAGAVSVTGKGLASAKASASGAEAVVVTVKASRAKRATLKVTGKLATKATVNFAPSNGGAAARIERALTLRRISPAN
ncbi:MAG: hypothetical protein JST59_05790 [Actinobacteria bacterium]|nr:hypothetical protein [Actinomycetota bacterium]